MVTHFCQWVVWVIDLSFDLAPSRRKFYIMYSQDFCLAYIAYVNAMVNNDRMPMNSEDYALQMNMETDNNDHGIIEITIN